MSSQRIVALAVFVLLIIFASVCTAEASEGPTTGFWIPSLPPTATYTISAKIDEDAHVLQGEETISLVNTTSHPITQVAFIWPRIDEKTARILVNGSPLTVELGSSRRLPILLALPEPLPPGRTLKIELAFKTGIDPSPKNHLLQRWHPELWWGFPVHSIYAVRLDAPTGYAIGTSGWFDEKEKVWRAEHVRQFGLFLGKGFMTSEAMAGDVQVRTVYTPAGSTCARVLLEHAVDVINFYRQRFGLYPYRSLTIIPGMDYPAGGYPAATSLIVVHGQEQFEKRDKDFWHWITAHEIGHQYWYEYVLSRDPDDIGWLVIGLGIYTDREYSRARGMLRRHENFGEQYENAVRNGSDTAIERTSEQYNAIDWDYNNAVMHGKGFSVISALAATLGQDTFERVYRRCLREYAGRRLGWREFEAIAEEESGHDLQSFFEQWIRSSRYPAYQVASSGSTSIADGSYVSEVRVEQLGTLKMPLPVAADFSDGSRQIKFTDGVSKLCALSFVSKQPLKNVQLDPDHEIAMVLPLPPPTTFDLAVRIDDLDGQDDAAALSLKEKIGDLKLDSNRLSRLSSVLYETKHYDATLEVLRRRKATLTDEDALLALQGTEAVLLDLSNRRSEAVAIYQKVLDKIGTRKFSIDEFGLEIDKSFLEGCLKAAYQRN